MKDWRKFRFTDDSFIITRESKTYKRTESGKSWKTKPETVETETVSAEHYTNYVTAIPFFNNFGYHASCRASCSYTYAGYLPTTITTISPMNDEKIVTTFSFSLKQ